MCRRRCVPGRQERADFLAIQMEADLVVVGDDWARPLGRLRDELSALPRKPQAFEHAKAHVVVRENQHAASAEGFVAADVIRVDMRIEQKPNLAIRDLPHRRHEAICQRRKE